MAIRAFFLSLLLLLICAACKKEPLFDGANCEGNCYILTGKLYDPAQGKNLPGVDLRFYYKEWRGMASSRTDYLGKAATDADGNYRFIFDGTNYQNKIGSFYMEAYKDNMFHDVYDGRKLPHFYLDSVQYGVPFNQDFPLYKPATIEIKVLAGKLDSGQSITVSQNFGKRGFVKTISGTGGPVNTTFTFKTAGGLMSYVWATKADASPITTIQDSVIIHANTTKQIEIRF